MMFVLIKLLVIKRYCIDKTLFLNNNDVLFLNKTARHKKVLYRQSLVF